MEGNFLSRYENKIDTWTTLINDDPVNKKKYEREMSDYIISCMPYMNLYSDTKEDEINTDNIFKVKETVGLKRKDIFNEYLIEVEKQNLARPIEYNRIDELEVIVKEKRLAAIKMEVCRDREPDKDFLRKVRKIATENNIVLIFDECTSGFRETFGGLHKKYQIEPDLAVFGKALGNGYAVTSVIGRRSIMEAGNSSFISSTFWTERIGSVAALKTLEVMERERSWEKVTRTGKKIKKIWQQIAENNSIDLNITGLDALCSFSILSKDALKYKTYITQEMLSKGYLAGNSIYVSTAHTDKILDDYYEILDGVFKTIHECENGRDINALLNGPVCHTGFKRLT